jgi:periplasmic protein TonB
MITRYAASTGTGVAVTFGLLFLMQVMIATGRPSLDGQDPYRIVPYVRVDPTTEEPVPEERPVRPPPPELPPSITPHEREGGGGVVIQITGPAPPEGFGPIDHEFGLIDGDAMPIVKVQPVYPAAARHDGREGYVIVEFTITRSGSVADVTVVESSDRVFERAAVDAALKFRYRPRVIDAEAVEVHGKRHVIRFEMEK